jgi:hypothetical protein
MNEEIQQIKSFVREFLKKVMESGEQPPDEIKEIVKQVLIRAQEKVKAIEAREAQVQDVQNKEAKISPDASLLWILAGQQEKPFISYLQQFQTPETQSLLSNPALLDYTINHLNQVMPQGQPLEVNGIQHADLNSSNVWGTAYNEKNGRMRVRFQNGSEYEYDGVPAAIYRAISQGNASAKTSGKNKFGQWWVGKNPSLGAALSQYVKSAGFNYRKLR